MLPQLTDRQRAIYDFILKTIREKGFAPSIPEIGRKFKIVAGDGSKLPRLEGRWRFANVFEAIVDNDQTLDRSSKSSGTREPKYGNSNRSEAV